MHNLAARRWVTRFIIAALALLGARAGAQGAPRFASPALPPDHWAVTAARRAVVLGLTPREIGWAEGSLTQALAGWALREASERSTSLAPAIHAAVAADWQRFAREFHITPDTRVLDIGGTPDYWDLIPVRPRITLLNTPRAKDGSSHKSSSAVISPSRPNGVENQGVPA